MFHLNRPFQKIQIITTCAILYSDANETPQVLVCSVYAISRLQSPDTRLHYVHGRAILRRELAAIEIYYSQGRGEKQDQLSRHDDERFYTLCPLSGRTFKQSRFDGL